MGEWISITDRLPEEEGDYLVIMENNVSMFGKVRHFRVYSINHFYPDTVEWYDDDDVITFDVTHWMALPPMPKDTEQYYLN